MKLQNIKEGDRLQYRGMEWTVKEHSNYKDKYGYQTEEWLLKVSGNKEYYLLKEIDPQNPLSQLNWYLAEKVENPRIFTPDYSHNLSENLWQVMQNQEIPYPELRMLGKSYFFESCTKGNYQEDGAKDERITWDYWDLEHQYNLAIEAWANGDLFVYSTQKINPEYFLVIQQNWLQNPTIKIFILMVAMFFIMVGCTLILG